MGIMVDADFLFFGGKVFTIDEKNPQAQGVAVKDGKIFRVGQMTRSGRLSSERRGFGI